MRRGPRAIRPQHHLPPHALCSLEHHRSVVVRHTRSNAMPKPSSISISRARRAGATANGWLDVCTRLTVGDRRLLELMCFHVHARPSVRMCMFVRMSKHLCLLRRCKTRCSARARATANCRLYVCTFTVLESMCCCNGSGSTVGIVDCWSSCACLYMLVRLSVCASLPPTSA